MAIGKVMHSRIYEGWVRHRRFSPTQNEFRYQVFMMYLDLSEIEEVMALSPLWGINRFRLAAFCRKDFMGDVDTPLDVCVRNHVESQLGWRPNGPIRLLANLRYFGYVNNPLTTYYCFDESGESISAIVAQVKNTPWGENHAYVLDVKNDQSQKKLSVGKGKFRCEFKKQLHVSPFNPMDMTYRWLSNEPGDHLHIHIENWQHMGLTVDSEQNGTSAHKILDATLYLHETIISKQRLNRILIGYPLMTVKVIAAIYWQAVRLLLKRTPFYSHPSGVA